MNKEQLSQLFWEYGISSECAGNSDDRSWSDVIHYPLYREEFMTYDMDPNLFDFIRYMRALCIKDAVFYVIIDAEAEDDTYFRYWVDRLNAIPVFSTLRDVDRFLRVEDEPFFVRYEEKKLIDLIEGLQDDAELLINPWEEVTPIKPSYYKECFRLAEGITEDRIKEILEERLRDIRHDFE